MGELGSLLTRAREARGLTLEDAERDTRISRRYLHALETEQFEVIPAPVYARGFLRSYSQYLGLDPQEMLMLFPREDDPEYQRAAEATNPTPRPSKERPVSPVSASRPTWRTQQPPAGGPRNQPPPDDRDDDDEPRPAQRPPRASQGQFPGSDYEPVIGVDIGIPTPATKLKVDPAAQTRSLVIAVVAIVAILAVVALAYLLSNLGGDDSPPGSQSPGATETTDTGGEPTGEATPGGETPSGSSGLDVTPGIVPNLVGVQEDVAKLAVVEAGYVVAERRVPHSDPAGTVVDQSPVADVELAAGSTVQIVISEGQ